MNLFALADGRRSFYQWDTDRQMIVNDETCTEVHFCNGSSDCSLVCGVYDRGDLRLVDVPNILLQETKRITAFAFVRDGSGGYTRRAVSYSVLARTKPESYMYTETEVLNYSSLDDRLSRLEGEGIADAVADYLKDHPVQAGATAEEAAQIAQNKEEIQKLSTDKLDANKLPEAINEALQIAKDSGEFNGEPGQDYVLTPADKTEIAEMAADLVDVPESSGVGISVTGATVGQTVKIAEVDENGVPTAWEAVDMSYTKTEIDAIMGSYITDIDTLLGGDS